MKMTKKFDDLNETFNVSDKIVPKDTEVIEKIEKISSPIDDIK